MALGFDPVAKTKAVVRKTAKKTPPPSHAGPTSGGPHFMEIPGYKPQTPTVLPSGQVIPGVSPKRYRREAQKRATATRERKRAVALLKPPKAKKASQGVKEPKPYKAPKLPTPVIPPQSKPQTFAGKKTAGTPTQKTLLKASKAKTLKVNKHGFVTTPQVRKVSAKLKKASKKSGPLHSTIVQTPEQSHVAKTILRTAKKVGADRKEKLAALTTGLQESGLKNLPIEGPGGGWRQEESAFYPASSIRNVKKGAENYFREAKASGRGKGETPAELSQTVQASGAGETYYEDNQGEARQLLHQFNKGQVPPKLQAQAKALGLGGKSVGKAPPKVAKKFKQAVTTMKQINSKHFEYQWGGGHAVAGSPTGGPGTGFDCSGAISAMLHSVGDLKAPLTSGSMGEALEPGPGAITVFYNGEHTFAYVPSLHKYWGTSDSNPGGGAGFFPKSVGDSEVASGNASGAYSVGHVPGLGKKQALELGGSLNFPGMSLSSGGTTATINPGAGATVGKPGFSTAPIKLTPTQKLNRAKAKLKRIDNFGKGTAPTAPAPEASSTLADLERKYSPAAV